MAEEAQNKKSPSEVVVGKLQDLGLIIESNIFLLQAVGDRKTLTRQECTTLILALDELEDKSAELAVWVSHYEDSLDK